MMARVQLKKEVGAIVQNSQQTHEWPYIHPMWSTKPRQNHECVSDVLHEGMGRREGWDRYDWEVEYSERLVQ